MEDISKKHIQLLPEHIIDQIKAGEVIERPATLIKELLENSIDAGSTNISIHIVNNGMDLISIEDNGIGIKSEDLHLAFCRHATSKINNFEDIYNLFTYGFRGEALASIASISRITCTSKRQGKSGLIKIHGGEVITHQSNDKSSENKTTNGTSIFVKDLFYNTPARLKFIQSKTSEKNQLKKILNAFLLTHPQITFSIKWDEQDRQVFPAIDAKDLEKRIQKMFFKKTPASFKEIKSSYDQVTFSCLLSNESSRGNAGKHQYLFINNRFVQDIQIHKIILNSSAGLWPNFETGHYFAFINLPADQLDVNVHPNKTVVKLYKAPQVFSQISSSIKKIITQQQQLPANSDRTENEVDHRPMSFFNNQSSDQVANAYSNSQNFETLEQKALNYKALNDLSEELHASNQNFSLIFSNDKFAIISISVEKNPILVHLKKLAWITFLDCLQQHNSSIPLLVSEPLRNLSENLINFLQQLNKHGFELDKLDNSTLILRAYPQQLDGLPYLDFLNILITNYSGQKMTIQSLIDDILSNHHATQPKLSSHAINNLINKFSLFKLQEQNIAIQIDNRKLEKLFYE